MYESWLLLQTSVVSVSVISISCNFIICWQTHLSVGDFCSMKNISMKLMTITQVMNWYLIVMGKIIILTNYISQHQILQHFILEEDRENNLWMFRIPDLYFMRIKYSLNNLLTLTAPTFTTFQLSVEKQIEFKCVTLQKCYISYLQLDTFSRHYLFVLLAKNPISKRAFAWKKLVKINWTRKQLILFWMYYFPLSVYLVPASWVIYSL